MASKVILSSLGVDITEATITSLVKKEGDEVQRGDVIALVETQKVSFEVVSPTNGFILKIMFEVGDTVKVGESVAIVGKKDEDISMFLNENLSQEKNGEIPIGTAEDKRFEERTKDFKSKIYPAVRKLAKDLKVDIDQIVGTGLNGMVTKEDIEHFYKKQQFSGDIVPLTGIRGTIARRMISSLRTAAHVTTIIEIDMSNVSNLRKEILDKNNFKITYLPFIIHAAVKAIKDVPIINSIILEDKIIKNNEINFGVAVVSNDSLLVPILFNAEKMDVFEISKKIEDLAILAREKRLLEKDMCGGTITISNGGAFGPILNTPIINQPQVALIWIGRITKKPVVIQDKIVIRDMMYLCLSYDHRAMDGRDAGTYINKIKEYLEEQR